MSTLCDREIYFNARSRFEANWAQPRLRGGRFCSPMDGQRASVQFADDAAQVGVESRFDLRGDDRVSVFRAENDMRQKIGEGKGHWNLMFGGRSGFDCTRD
jgi:hypothetical protein